MEVINDYALQDTYHCFSFCSGSIACDCVLANKHHCYRINWVYHTALPKSLLYMHGDS